MNVNLNNQLLDIRSLMKNSSIIIFSLILISFLFVYKASAESQFPAGPGGYCDNSGNNTCDTSQSLVCVFTEQTASGLWKGNCLVAGPTSAPIPTPTSTSTPQCKSDIDCIDSNPCTVDYCLSGLCVSNTAPEGKACNFDSSGQATTFCNASGICSVQASTPTTPPTPTPTSAPVVKLLWKPFIDCTIPPTDTPIPSSSSFTNPDCTNTSCNGNACKTNESCSLGNNPWPCSCVAKSTILPTSTPTKTSATPPTPKPCSGQGYGCRTDQPSGCQLAPTGIFDCSLPGSNMITNWGGEKCVICAVPTQAPAVGPGGGSSGGSGSSGSNATAPTSSDNSVILNFGGVLLPGMVANAIPVTITMFNGSVSDTLITAPEKFSLQRPTGSNGMFTGSNVSLNLPSRITRQTTGNFYVSVGVKSYKKETVAIGQEDSTQPGTGHRFLSSSVQVPNITLLPGDINNDGEIGLVDYQILRACFGVKESSPECAVQKQNGQLVPDINRDSRVDGIDINLLWRGANNVATN